MRKLIAAIAVTTVLAACSDSAPDTDAGQDLSSDVTQSDAATDDSASGSDSAVGDSTASDSATTDSATGDSAISDSAPNDSAIADQGAMDAMCPEAGSDAANCGGGSGPMGTCAGTAPVDKVAFNWNATVNSVTDTAVVKSKHFVSSGTITEQRCSEERTVGTTTVLLNAWAATSPASYNQWVLVPIVAGPQGFAFSEYTSFNCLFPSYAKKMRSCMSSEPTTCMAPDFMPTGQVKTVAGQACHVFTVFAVSQVTVCIPLDCQLRRTLYPAEVTGPGTTIEYQSLQEGTFPDTDLDTP